MFVLLTAGYMLDFLHPPSLSSFTNVYCLCNAVIIFTQGRGRSEVETQPSWERTNSDGGLEVDSCRGEKSRSDPGSEARVGRRAALATGSCEFFGEWKMSHGETCCTPAPLPPPTRHPKMTPDPLTCLYQAMEMRNSDESLLPCVYTPESRKEGNQPRSAKSGEKAAEKAEDCSRGKQTLHGAEHVIAAGVGVRLFPSLKHAHFGNVDGICILVNAFCKILLEMFTFTMVL
ncbi:uncharacterized protein LOC122843063 [Gambusia affinis]|uniref:uncharacterized protein LOC122843063 n=1 Tax=Gambusia affinis TaxID=33528 RepID=UPI001CDC4216|nr:uncharacterized protein LOC122843063 [Gambusia affinis]